MKLAVQEPHGQKQRKHITTQASICFSIEIETRIQRSGKLINIVVIQQIRKKNKQKRVSSSKYNYPGTLQLWITWVLQSYHRSSLSYIHY